VFGKTVDLIAVVATLFPPAALMLLTGSTNDVSLLYAVFGRHGKLPVIPLLSGKRSARFKGIVSLFRLRVNSSVTPSSIRFHRRLHEKRWDALPLTT